MGRKLTQEHRRNISKSKQRHWRKYLLTEELPEKKRCSRCKETKDAAEFSIRKYKRKSVPVVEKLEAACKKCNARIAKERRNRRIAEGIDVHAIERARQKAHRERLSTARLEQLRERHREWQAAKRREEGAKPRGSYGKRRKAQSLTAGQRLDAQPLIEILERELPHIAKEHNESNSNGTGLLAVRSGVSERRLYELLHGRQQTVTLSVVDRLLTGLGLPHMLPILYPD